MMRSTNTRFRWKWKDSDKIDKVYFSIYLLTDKEVPKFILGISINVA